MSDFIIPDDDILEEDFIESDNEEDFENDEKEIFSDYNADEWN